MPKKIKYKPAEEIPKCVTIIEYTFKQLSIMSKCFEVSSNCTFELHMIVCSNQLNGFFCHYFRVVYAGCAVCVVSGTH